MRAQPRVGANFPIRVHSRDFAIPLEGSARDLSVNGACVATTAPFAVKSIQQIELILPQQTLVLEAEGRWQRDEPIDDLVLTGISFVALDSAARGDLPETF